MESFTLGLNTALIGMGVIFIVLIILNFATVLLQAFVNKFVAKSDNKAKAEKQNVVAPAVNTAVATNAGSTISPAIVAAITAAIAANTGKAPENFKFTAITRVSGCPSSWAMQSNVDIIANRQRYVEGGNK